MQKLDWSDMAECLANFAHEAMFSTHRGAAQISEEVAVIFGNDGNPTEIQNSSYAEVKELRRRLVEAEIEEIGFGLSNEEGYSWAMIVRAMEDDEDLNQLVWDCWFNNERRQLKPSTEAGV